MKNFIRLAAIALLGATFASCSDNEPEIVTPDESGSRFYATLRLQLPVAGRSTTDTPNAGNDPAQSSSGYEEGQDYENAISNVTVVLAKDQGNGIYKVLTSANGTPTLTNSEENAHPIYTMQFRTETIKGIAQQESKDARTVNVFAFCNGAPDESTLMASEGQNMGLDAILNMVAGGTTGNPITIEIAQKNGFLMTSATLLEKEIPTWDYLLANNTTAASACDLGTVSVERVASRFDFMQTTAEGQTEANVYPMTNGINELNDNTTHAVVRLTAMSLFNEAKEFFYLRHMSADGTNTSWTVCTQENPSNYVVSPNWAAVQAYDAACSGGDNTTTTGIATPLPADLAAKYFFPIATIASSNETVWTPLGTPNTDDNHTSNQNPTWPNNTGDTNINTDGYHIWRYASENTIPGVNAQRVAVTTGVVFRGDLQPVSEDAANDENLIVKAMNEGETLYAFNFEGSNTSKTHITKFFGSLTDFFEYVKTPANTLSPEREAFDKALRAGYFVASVDGTEVTVDEETDLSAEIYNATGEVTIAAGTDGENNKLLSKINILAYVCTKEEGVNHYYNYYYYYNRHNDNGMNEEMGPMEFATVRNNIYKLAVEEVSAVGLPADLPPDPGTPDEVPEVYFKVSVRVLDWVVRINNIKF